MWFFATVGYPPDMARCEFGVGLYCCGRAAANDQVLGVSPVPAAPPCWCWCCTISDLRSSEASSPPTSSAKLACRPLPPRLDPSRLTVRALAQRGGRGGRMQGAGMPCGEVLRKRRRVSWLPDRPCPQLLRSSAWVSTGTLFDVVCFVPKTAGGDLEECRPLRPWGLLREGDPPRQGEPHRWDSLALSPLWQRRSREPLGVRILSSVTTSDSEATFCCARANSSSK